MTFSLPYVVVVSDGTTICALHPRAFGRDELQLEQIVARALAPAGARLHVQDAHEPAPAKAHPDTLTQREIATTSGYTGNSCQTCGSFSMRRSGTCETCEGCGSTSGGCS